MENCYRPVIYQPLSQDEKLLLEYLHPNDYLKCVTIKTPLLADVILLHISQGKGPDNTTKFPQLDWWRGEKVWMQGMHSSEGGFGEEKWCNSRRLLPSLWIWCTEPWRRQTAADEYINVTKGNCQEFNLHCAFIQNRNPSWCKAH